MDHWLAGHGSAWVQFESTALWKKAMSRFLRFATPERMPRILEVGCGSGSFFRDILTRTESLHAVASEWPLVEAARKHCPEANIVRCDPRNLPYPDNTFSLVYVLGPICCEDDLHEMIRVTRPGGSIATIYPRLDCDIQELLEHPDLKDWSVEAKEALKRLFAEARQRGELDANIAKRFVELNLIANRTVEIAGGAFLMAKGRLRF